MHKLCTLTLLALVMTATAAFGITVDINGANYTTADSLRAYDFIRKSSSSSDSGADKINVVDYILKGRLSAGNHTYTLVNGSTNSNPLDTWFATGAASIIIKEIAGYANSNTFGYYTHGTSNSIVRHQLFSGPEGVNAVDSFQLSPAAQFGFYLGVPQTNNTYYTEADLNPNQEIHAAIFQIDDSNSYILGFEDLALSTGDRDYQDMILEITVNPVPEPSTFLLLAGGLLTAGIMRRRMKK